uniref:Lysozyme like 6 n=1 Tax=Molossus molossus TaxID=27622 RepID=A0A7J8CZM1_MOLMO|nr:lysozyme like 6 [Molossus molossus]
MLFCPRCTLLVQADVLTAEPHEPGPPIGLHQSCHLSFQAHLPFLPGAAVDLKIQPTCMGLGDGGCPAFPSSLEHGAVSWVGLENSSRGRGGSYPNSFALQILIEIPGPAGTWGQRGIGERFLRLSEKISNL